MDYPREKPKFVELGRCRRLSNHIPDIDKLNIMGFHSMNTNYEFADNLSQLRYLKLPGVQRLNLDLKITSNRTIRRKFTPNQTMIDPLLKWIIEHWEECGETPTRGIWEIVCLRGLLMKVMISPYERLEGWLIGATKFQGKIYLCKYATPEKVLAEENMTEKEKNFADWGLVFEQYMVSDHPKHSPDMSLPTDQNEEFHCVFRTRLGHHNLLYSCEMDGLEDKLASIEESISDPANLKDLLEKGHAKFIELKTSAHVSCNQYEWFKFCRFKSLKWWAQCYTSGIQDIICGYRGDDGIIRSLQTFRVSTLPRLGLGHWSPDVCLDYCSRFLDLVTNHVSNGPDEVLWSFIWNPQNPDYIEIGQIDKDSEYSFLRGWFTDKLRENEQRRGKANPSTSSLRDHSDVSKA